MGVPRGHLLRAAHGAEREPRELAGLDRRRAARVHVQHAGLRALGDQRRAGEGGAGASLDLPKANDRRFGRLSALRAHTKAPCKDDLL